VANRSIFVPINADTELSEPTGLQAKINNIVSQYSSGRSFVRPSGTEDIVRVYSEAETRQMTDDLSNRICGLVFDNYGGVGERPARFK
jgi:phosphoacetylglucosamine mutase